MEKRDILELLKYFDNEVLREGNRDYVVSEISTDSRSIKMGDLFLPLVGDNFDGHDFIDATLKSGASAVIIEKDKFKQIDSELLNKNNVWVFGVNNTLKAYHEIAKSYLESFPKLKKVAVTGSSGKTTTKEIIKAILSAKYHTFANKGNLNNRFGVPKTALEVTNDVEVAIFEMGMGAPGDIEKLAWIVRPDVACITSIGEAHIEFFDSIKGIAETKKGIFKYFDDENYAVLNEDDEFYSILIHGTKGKKITFNKNKSKKIKIIDNLGVNGYKLKVNHIDVLFPLGGGHNLINLYYGICIGEIFGLDDSEIVKGIKNIQIPSLRNQIKKGKYLVLLDCYNANPSSMKAALTYFNNIPLKETRNKKIVVLADMLELGDKGIDLHFKIGKYIGKECKNIEYVFTFGSLGEQIAKGAVKTGFDSSKVFSCSDKRKLSNDLQKVLTEGDMILFKASRGMKLEDVADTI